MLLFTSAFAAPVDDAAAGSVAKAPKPGFDFVHRAIMSEDTANVNKPAIS